MTETKSERERERERCRGRAIGDDANREEGLISPINDAGLE